MTSGQFTFTFDQDRCTGCKACQIACKDDNRLPVGVTWRRVYESSGGGWPVDSGGLVAADVFTYYTSMSCNHCTDPICVSVCPSTAMHKGEAGLVLVDSETCIGCGYCAMACPYEAPQFRSDLGIMSKCDGCFDRVQQGLSPACVAACPTRALGFELGEGPVAAPPPQIEPLPDPALTRPNLVLTAHPKATRIEPEKVATVPRHEPDIAHEAPLAVFTVLAQAAAGLAFGLGGAMLWGAAAGESPLPLVATIVAGVILAVALGVSASHLGSPLRALNSLRNLRASWLSREIVVASLFGGALIVLGGLLLIRPEATALRVILAVATGLAGLVLVLAIGRVYTLRTVPAWNSGYTSIGFLVTAGAVGPVLLATLAGLTGGGVGSQTALYLVGAGVLLAGRWARSRHLVSLESGSSAARCSREILTVSHPELRRLGRRSGWSAMALLLAAAAAALWWPPAAPVLGAGAVTLLLTNQLVMRLFFYRSMIREGR